MMRSLVELLKEQRDKSSEPSKSPLKTRSKAPQEVDHDEPDFGRRGKVCFIGLHNIYVLYVIIISIYILYIDSYVHKEGNVRVVGIPHAMTLLPWTYMY